MISTARDLRVTRPLPSAEGTTQTLLRTFTTKSSLDCLICAIFSRQRSLLSRFCRIHDDKVVLDQ